MHTMLCHSDAGKLVCGGSSSGSGSGGGGGGSGGSGGDDGDESTGSVLKKDFTAQPLSVVCGCRIHLHYL